MPWKFPNSRDLVLLVNHRVASQIKGRKLNSSYPLSELTVSNSSSQKIICDIITCKQEFDSVTAFNSHYNTNHRHTCDECKKVLPTPHLLDLHLSETHDSFFAVAALKKPMYSCYLETCNHKSQNDKERKDHCIKSHNFPPNFRFSGNKRKPKKNKKASENENSMEIDESSRTSGELFTRPVITKFAFGKTSKLFIPKGKKSTKSNILENDSTMVTDLMESLPS